MCMFQARIQCEPYYGWLYTNCMYIYIVYIYIYCIYIYIVYTYIVYIYILYIYILYIYVYVCTRIDILFFHIYQSVVPHKGGGRSFKDRKLWERRGFCDTWMAERTHWWSDGSKDGWGSQSLSLSNSLSVTFSLCRRALFDHLSFQKYSDNGGFFRILTWKRASRHSGVLFFDLSSAPMAPHPPL